MHVVITVGVLLFIVSVHIGLIRRRGVAPPPGAEALEVPDGEPGHRRTRAEEAQMATRVASRRAKRHPLAPGRVPNASTT